jgi:hypothetical protein
MENIQQLSIAASMKICTRFPLWMFIEKSMKCQVDLFFFEKNGIFCAYKQREGGKRTGGYFLCAKKYSVTFDISSDDKCVLVQSEHRKVTA